MFFKIPTFIPSDMKRSDIIFFICTILFFAPFFVFDSVYDSFLWATRNHPFLMSFIKFGILSTAGECIGMRIRTGSYAPKGFGIVPRGITWGLLGILISAAMTIFSSGVPTLLSQIGITPGTTTYPELINQSIVATKSWYHAGAAFAVSVFMNCLFAPVFMVLHKVSDTHIMNNGGTLGGYFSRIHFKEIFINLDWATIWSFLFKKTIPLFWIPAHTITFMLVPEYRVLFAALLGVMLGVFMSLASRKK